MGTHGTSEEEITMFREGASLILTQEKKSMVDLLAMAQEMKLQDTVHQSS